MAHPRQALTRLGAQGFRFAQRRTFSNLLASDGPRPRIYISNDTDPYLNLSIEHYLLQNSHPDSTILFIYRNRPCIVIGRNQNPWLEVNLGQLRRGVPQPSLREIRTEDAATKPIARQSLASPEEQEQAQPNQAVSLVRRRSGGGTVFHDEGNVNWMVICPPAAFDRDRHAEMVARALGQRLGVSGVRVNCRHDIVMDVGAGVGGSPPDSEKETFKVSGSAYKLTRLRSLHHGTCLLRSPNLKYISQLLRSPAEPFIKARGVESVRSKVRNVDVEYADFVAAVRHEFELMYGEVEGGDAVVGRPSLQLPEVQKGVQELESPEWIFGQTPLFTFCTYPTENDSRQRPELPESLPQNFQVSLSARHGQIQEASFSGLPYADDIDGAVQDQALNKALIGKSIHHIDDWRRTLKDASPVPVDSESIGSWLNSLLSVKSINLRDS